MKLRIDRTKWLRGEGDFRSYLLRPEDEKMCCLGFYGQALGIPYGSLLGCCAPSDSELFKAKPEASWLIKGDSWKTKTCGELMEVNDVSIEKPNGQMDVHNIVHSESEREARLTKLFAANGVEVEFYD